MTAQIARKRNKDETVPTEDVLETKVLGEFSWQLFRWQLVLFGVGAIASAIALLAKTWS